MRGIYRHWLLVYKNRECVKIQTFVSFAGEKVCACQVVFKASGITSTMAPPIAISKICHLLISTSENGVSTNETFLDAVREFNAYLTEHGIKRPVVLLSDGHSSRMNYEVLLFLFQNDIWLFITPADNSCVCQICLQQIKLQG